MYRMNDCKDENKQKLCVLLGPPKVKEEIERTGCVCRDWTTCRRRPSLPLTAREAFPQRSDAAYLPRESWRQGGDARARGAHLGDDRVSDGDLETPESTRLGSIADQVKRAQ